MYSNSDVQIQNVFVMRSGHLLIVSPTGLYESRKLANRRPHSLRLFTNLSKFQNNAQSKQG